MSVDVFVHVHAPPKNKKNLMATDKIIIFILKLQWDYKSGKEKIYLITYIGEWVHGCDNDD